MSLYYLIEDGSVERSLVAKPKSPDSEEPLEEYYACEDFYVGSVVVLNTFTLGLIDCDAFTRSILEVSCCCGRSVDASKMPVCRTVKGSPFATTSKMEKSARAR